MGFTSVLSNFLRFSLRAGVLLSAGEIWNLEIFEEARAGVERPRGEEGAAAGGSHQSSPLPHHSFFSALPSAAYGISWARQETEYTDVGEISLPLDSFPHNGGPREARAGYGFNLGGETESHDTKTRGLDDGDEEFSAPDRPPKVQTSPRRAHSYASRHLHTRSPFRETAVLTAVITLLLTALYSKHGRLRRAAGNIKNQFVSGVVGEAADAEGKESSAPARPPGAETPSRRTARDVSHRLDISLRLRESAFLVVCTTLLHATLSSLYKILERAAESVLIQFVRKPIGEAMQSTIGSPQILPGRAQNQVPVTLAGAALLVTAATIAATTGLQFISQRRKPAAETEAARNAVGEREAEGDDATKADFPGELDLRGLPVRLEIVRTQGQQLKTPEEAAASPLEVVYRPGNAASREAQEKMEEVAMTAQISPKLQDRLMDGLHDLKEADSHLDYEMRVRRLFTLSQRIELQVVRRNLLRVENLLREGKLKGNRHFVTQQLSSHRSFLEGLRSDADGNYHSMVVVLQHKRPQEGQVAAISDFLKVEHQVLHSLVGGLLQRVTALESCIDPAGGIREGRAGQLRQRSQEIGREVTAGILKMIRRTRHADLPPIFTAPWGRQ